MHTKIISFIDYSFEKIPFHDVIALEIDDYQRGQSEKVQAKLLSNLLQKNYLEKHVFTDAVWDIYKLFANGHLFENRELIQWLLYGGIFNYCIKNTILAILDKEDLSADSLTWIGLPMFAINKMGANDIGLHRVKYKNEDSMIERLAEFSKPGLLTTGKDNVCGKREYEFFKLHFPKKSAVCIRMNGQELRVITPSGYPTFILDFYTDWPSMFAHAFR